MNTATQNISTENKRRLLILFVLFLLTSVGMFGQTKVATTALSTSTISEVVKIPAQQVALDSDIDFMNWFMGSKQTQTVKEGNGDNENTVIARKKQILSSGVTPNKVLYRTFVKKVISQESATV
jgi:hypothetical protein